MNGGEAVRSERARPPAAPAVVAAGLIALALAMGIGRFAFTPILPMMQQEAGVSVGQGGWLASANYLGYLLGALSAIALGIPATAAIRAGLVVIGVVTLGMGLTQSFAAWLVLRGVAGIGSAWVLVFASSWALARLSAGGRPVLKGAVFAGVGIGIAVAGGVCLVLMQQSLGSARAWQGLGGIALGGTAAIWRMLRAETGGDETYGQREEPSRLAWDRDSLRLVFCYGAFGFGYIIPATFVPAMARLLVSDPLVFGWSWPVFGVAAAGSTIVAAAGTRRLGNRRLWALSHLIMALGVAVPVAWPTITGIMVAALLVGGTFMVNTMAGMQEARTVAGPRAASLMAVMTAAFAVGQIAGPLLVTHTVGPDADVSRPLLLACLLLLASGVALCRPRPPTHAAPATIDEPRGPRGPKGLKGSAPRG